MASALGEDEAVSTATECIDYVGEDLLVARLVFGERAVDSCDGARDGQVDGSSSRNSVGWTTSTGTGSVGARAFEGVGVGVVKV